MKFSLIICTYMRPEALSTLLDSVSIQTIYPSEILIIDGSTDDRTTAMIANKKVPNLCYFKVGDEDRGLTKQRNFGIARTDETIEVICFLDDDTIPESDYFENLMATYHEHPEALGAGGYITNEASWEKVPENYAPSATDFLFDGWKRKDGSRYVLRKKLGLDSDMPPGIPPEFGHGRSTGFLPPSGRIYETKQFMGGVSSFRKAVFERFMFSTYFIGYGLYEDADFTLRLSQTGKLYVNTAARLGHFHHESGRPNKYRYGKMVVRNGWYVWRIKDREPSFRARAKWHCITLLLTFVRLGNVFSTRKRAEALTEAAGRFVGWFSLFYNQPVLRDQESNKSIFAK